MKPDEVEFLSLMYKYDRVKFAVNIFNEDIVIPRKRAAYLLDKWSRKGFYDYGTTLQRGWLTEEGKRFVEENVINT